MPYTHRITSVSGSIATQQTVAADSTRLALLISAITQGGTVIVGEPQANGLTVFILPGKPVLIGRHDVGNVIQQAIYVSTFAGNSLLQITETREVP